MSVPPFIIRPIIVPAKGARALAERLCGGRLVSLLEGGYNLEVLAECAQSHVLSLATGRVCDPAKYTHPPEPDPRIIDSRLREGAGVNRGVTRRCECRCAQRCAHSTSQVQ